MKMKTDTWGFIFGYLVAITAVGCLIATFVTFVIGLFVSFPLTLDNIGKVWAAIVVFNVLTANFRK